MSYNLFKIGDRVDVPANNLFSVIVLKVHPDLHEVVVQTGIGDIYTYDLDRVIPARATSDIFSLADTLRATPKNDTSIKADNGKPDLTDIPLEAMWQMGAAFTYGQKKYEKSNFRKSGMKVSRQLAAAIRHIYQHLDGETIDAETKSTTHLGHAMASIAMAIYNLKHHSEMDDRFEADKEKYENK